MAQPSHSELDTAGTLSASPPLVGEGEGRGWRLRIGETRPSLLHHSIGTALVVIVLFAGIMFGC